jgi:hemerythrin-like metal-binding protein
MDNLPSGPTGPIVLDHSLRLGLPAVDEQHQRLIYELNRLIVDAQATPSSEAFGEVMSRLGTELDDHFGFEEALFEELGLPAPQIDAHVAAHTEILKQYTDLHLDLMRQKSLRRVDVLRQIRQWIVGHIATHDVKMRRHTGLDLVRVG